MRQSITNYFEYLYYFGVESEFGLTAHKICISIQMVKWNCRNGIVTMAQGRRKRNYFQRTPTTKRSCWWWWYRWRHDASTLMVTEHRKRHTKKTWSERNIHIGKQNASHSYIYKNTNVNKQKHQSHIEILGLAPKICSSTQKQKQK